MAPKMADNDSPASRGATKLNRGLARVSWGMMICAARVGESARALFVIDSKGIIRWSMLSPDGVNPGADGILSALEKLQPSVHASS